MRTQMGVRGVVVLVATIAISAAVGCSSASPTPSTTDGGDEQDSGSGDDSATSGVPSGPICDLFLSKNCPGVENTPAHRALCVQAYDVAATRGCKPYIDKGWACLGAKGASALTCQFNDVFVTDPTCAESGTAMAKCTSAVTDPKCYAGSCTSFTDCPTGYSCNLALGQCFDNAHSCIGAPCNSFTDCSTGTTCNQALKLCTKQ